MARDSGPRRPDFLVSALVKGGEHKGNVGAAWQEDNGQISIKLNPFVVLESMDGLAIRLFPNDGGKSPLPYAEEVGDADSVPRRRPF